jgi:hypothetical protein
MVGRSVEIRIWNMQKHLGGGVGLTSVYMSFTVLHLLVGFTVPNNGMHPTPRQHESMNLEQEHGTADRVERDLNRLLTTRRRPSTNADNRSFFNPPSLFTRTPDRRPALHSQV